MNNDPASERLTSTQQGVTASGISGTAPKAARSTRRSQLYRSFVQSENGAVTVDWVVLTASIVGLGFVVVFAIGGGTQSSVVQVQESLLAVEVGFDAIN